MTRRRFHAPPSAFNLHRGSVTLATDEARYLREVLRLKVGDEVYVFDGAGKEFRSHIEESRRDTATLKVIEEVAAARPAKAELRVRALATPGRPERAAAGRPRATAAIRTARA